MLSHRNILGNAQAILALVKVYEEDVFLSFLPLSHMLERTGSYILPMIAGSTVAYARSVSQLGEDMQTIAPSVIIAVPRVFERVHARIGAQLSHRPALIRRLFALTVAAGWRDFEHRQGRGRWHPLLLLWPLLRRVFSQPVLDKFGGRMRAAVSGGAPLPFEVAHLLVGLGLPLIQGYGLTETSPVIAVNPLENNYLESVGVPLPGMEVRLGADSELQVRGPGVMLGYWNNPEATAAVLDAAGWLRTGDQARIAGQHLYITGRIKDIMVLSNGEKVSPADLEMAIGLDPLFEQVMIVGEGQAFLAALLVLDAQAWPPLAREFGLDPGSRDSLANPLLHKAMLKRVRDALGDFPGYAKIRRVLLLLDPWTIDNGLMTPTLKFRRNRVIEQYRAEIERLYESGT
jgi:long-chain acyl-CoA synthetase